MLCGYLRLPYSLELGKNHQLSRTLKMPVLREGSPEEELRFEYRQNDKEVRQTIVRCIAAHLQKTATTSWSSNDFDFTGSHLEAPDFSGAVFSGEYTLFNGATFSGQNTSFKTVDFGGKVSFETPKVWSPAPTFDWDTVGVALTPKPTNVEPQDWPSSPLNTKSQPP